MNHLTPFLNGACLAEEERVRALRFVRPRDGGDSPFVAARCG